MYGLLQTENIRSARCSRVVLSKLLAARKATLFVSARVRKKIAVLGTLANARHYHSSPLRVCYIYGISRSWEAMTSVKIADRSYDIRGQGRVKTRTFCNKNASSCHW